MSTLFHLCFSCLDNFCVVHQSSACTMAPGETILLYCVSSQHTSSTDYLWSNESGDVGMNSPVLYVNKPGIYRCVVSNKRRRLGPVYSRTISVTESSGMTLTFCYVAYIYVYNINRTLSHCCLWLYTSYHFNHPSNNSTLFQFSSIFYLFCQAACH